MQVVAGTAGVAQAWAMRHRGEVMRALGRHVRLIEGDPCRRKSWMVPTGGPGKPTGWRRTVRTDARGALDSGGALVFVDEAAQDIHAFDPLMLPALCEAVSSDWCAQVQAAMGSGRAVVR